MNKEEILTIASIILSEENIVATHGTSIEHAKNIMETGLEVKRTTYVLYPKIRDPRMLATYGWKENNKGDAANVVVTIPGIFFEQLFGVTKEEAKEIIKNFRERELVEELIRDLADTTILSEQSYKSGSFNIPAMPRIIYTIPKEFIVGIFVYQNNTNYLSFVTPDGFDYEHALENLTFFDNPNFFDNLPVEAQEEFVKSMREKLNLEQPKR